jgi:hypothetical protein
MKANNSKRNCKNWIRILLAIILSLSLMPLNAQDQDTDTKKWEFNIAPYLLFPYMNGEVVIQGIPVEVDENPGDIFSNLNWGAMLYFEASSPKWAFVFDVQYMDLGADGQTPLLSRKASVGLDQLALAISGRYRITEWADIGIGARLNSIGGSVKVAPGDLVLPGTDFSMNETWLDPFIVTRVMTNLNDSKWRLALSADIGGFGIGSDLAWQINPSVGYQFTKLFQLGVEYRWFGMKYETGSGTSTGIILTDLFLYDVTTSGPAIKFSFHF